jgi:hypothetical protein
MDVLGQLVALEPRQTAPLELSAAAKAATPFVLRPNLSAVEIAAAP